MDPAVVKEGGGERQSSGLLRIEHDAALTIYPDRVVASKQKVDAGVLLQEGLTVQVGAR
jgi:hypothetical protein